MSQGRTKVANNLTGGAIPVFHYSWGSLQILSVAGGGARDSTELGNGPFVFIRPRRNVHIRLHNGKTPGGGISIADPIAFRNETLIMERARGETFLSVLREGASTLNMDEPAVDDTILAGPNDVYVWQADTYVPAPWNESPYNPHNGG